MDKTEKKTRKRDWKARAQARREARLMGFEHRPTTADKSDEAERLERGFAMMEEHEDTNEDDTTA